MQRFLEKLVANAAKTGRPMSAEQRLAAQARGLLPLELRQGADLAWLSHAESAAASASGAASSTATAFRHSMRARKAKRPPECSGDHQAICRRYARTPLSPMS